MFFVALIISVTFSKFYFPVVYYYSDPPSLLSIENSFHLNMSTKKGITVIRRKNL